MDEERIVKQKTELKNLKNSQPVHVAKKKKRVCFEENMKGVAGLSLDKLITHMIYGVNQPFQQNPVVEMGLY